MPTSAPLFYAPSRAYAVTAISSDRLPLVSTGAPRLSPLALGIRASAPARRTVGRMKSREEQLSWAKQRALICVDMGRFSDAVASLRADLAENSLTKGVMSSEHAMRGYKAAMDAALGRSSQALTEWIEGFR
jgi:hypothetical protein